MKKVFIILCLCILLRCTKTTIDTNPIVSEKQIKEYIGDEIKEVEVEIIDQDDSDSHQLKSYEGSKCDYSIISNEKEVVGVQVFPKEVSIKTVDENDNECSDIGVELLKKIFIENKELDKNLKDKNEFVISQFNNKYTINKNDLIVGYHILK